MPEDHLENAIALAENILQPVRDHFGVVTISSGYRSSDLNAAIGGSNRSQHSKGQAADFEVPSVDNFVIAEWINDNLDFDQLILEFYDSSDPYSGWIHCSYSSENRNQVLTAVKEDGKTLYKQGLIC